MVESLHIAVTENEEISSKRIQSPGARCRDHQRCFDNAHIVAEKTKQLKTEAPNVAFDYIK